MKKRSVGRPRDGNPAETRREILRAAEQSFADAGFVGATTRQVAARAGVNVATLHYHFGNKEGLYRAVMSEASGGSLPSPPATGSPAERLSRFVEALYDFGAARPPLPRLATLDRLVGPPGSEGPRRREEEDPRLAALRGLLAALDGSGSSRALPPDVAARWILALIDGSLLALRGTGNGHGPPPDAVGKAAITAAALRAAGLGS